MQMRDVKGKLISVWVPGNHGAGGSTISIALGTALQHMTNKKTLIVNMGSPKNYLEQYIQNDVQIRFSMDYLKSFDLEINTGHIKTYSSPVNDTLSILPNSKIDREINKVGESFYQRFLEKALAAYEIVIVDLETGLCKEKQTFLEHADMILAVMDSNEIMLKELLESNNEIKAYVKNEKTLPVFNALHDNGKEVKNVNRLNKSLGLKGSYGISFDADSNRAACSECKLYSFLKKELNKKRTNSLLVLQTMELCRIVLDKLVIPIEDVQDNPNPFSKILLKAKLWGEIDA